MKVVYETHARCVCPAYPDKEVIDYYAVEITSKVMVQVEIILLEIQKLEGRLWQEDFTEQLASKLQCQVKTVGYHSGVKTTVTCGE